MKLQTASQKKSQDQNRAFKSSVVVVKPTQHF